MFNRLPPAGAPAGAAADRIGDGVGAYHGVAALLACVNCVVAPD
jgi:hypothetical protein